MEKSTACVVRPSFLGCLWNVTSTELESVCKGKLTKTNDTLVELKTSLTIRGERDGSQFEK